MTQRQENIFRFVLLLNVIFIPALLVGYQAAIQPALHGVGPIDIQAAIAESGGFKPGNIQAQVGQKITLRFNSTDLPHGIAIGPGVGVDIGPVIPGKIKEVTLTFDRPGRYTYYCNTWCSPNHWRMRGVIEVTDPAIPAPVVESDPVIAALLAEGVNIDAVHEQPTAGGHGHQDEAITISAQRGASLVNILTLPPEARDENWRRSHTPAQAVALLAASNPTAADADLRDVAAYLWTAETSPEALAQASVIYAKNCLACHGATGGGDGFMAAQTAAKPVAFADVRHMLEMRPDVLYAKIRRGGMGTDMPNWGTIFTPDETWALVDYLWTLAFNPK